MTTVVDFDALQGPEILLLGNTKVSRARTGGGFSGFSAVDSIWISAQVSNVRGVRQPSITVRVDGSEDGLSWSEVCSFDFTASGVQKQLVASPPDQLRVVSVPGGGLHEAVVLSVVAVPETINTRNVGGGSLPVLSDSGAPDNADGVDGQLYVDTDAHNIYLKTGGSWT